jgi:hypothetical protein
VSTADELDVPYRAAESRVDELRQAVRYAELCASHLTLEPLPMNMVVAFIEVLKGYLTQAEATRDAAAEAVRVAWEAEQAARAE